jgi:hypothetical protein
MRDKGKFLLRTGALVLCVFLLACGDPVTRAKGTVRDQNGNPLEGVTIVLESNAKGDLRKEAEQKTKTDGSYSFTEITAPATQAKLIFTKDGFKRSEKEVTPDKENINDIVLERN